MPKVNREIMQQPLKNVAFDGFGQWHTHNAKSKQILYIAIPLSVLYQSLQGANKGLNCRRATSAHYHKQEIRKP